MSKRYDRDTIADMLCQGKTYRAIEDATGCSSYVIKCVAHEYGLVRQHHKPERHVWTPSEDRQLVATAEFMGTRLGVSPHLAAQRMMTVTKRQTKEG